jgi:NAD(P)-dependent dehydrogenase (short-subunit alcohol dehydrogenase family)
VNFDGKVVLVTGAASGIGAECARKFARRGARVVAAGTSMLQAAPPEVAAAAVEMAPVKRTGRPGEVAAFICFLASEETSFVTGSYHAVDGGHLAQ